MKLSVCCLIALTALVCACSGEKSADRDPAVPTAAAPITPAPTRTDVLPERPPIDLGDVDSGIFILGTLAPESDTATINAAYMETMRDTLSLATITVRPPFPETLLIQFEMTSRRDFIERPVIVRVRAWRDEDTQIGEEHAYIMGRNASGRIPDDSGIVVPRSFVVDALEGLDEIPDTMLVHARADAWLMETGADEDALDPYADTGPERVALFSNPVRINFEHPEAAQ